MEEIIFLIRDSEENLLLYLNADGSLKAEVKPGAARYLPKPPISHVYGTPQKIEEISEDHPLYVDALLNSLYDQGFYNDEMFIEVDDKDAIDNIFNNREIPKKPEEFLRWSIIHPEYVWCGDCAAFHLPGEHPQEAHGGGRLAGASSVASGFGPLTFLYALPASV